MSLLVCLGPLQKFGVGGGGWWWSKGVLEFTIGQNLGLRLEAGTKLNKNVLCFFKIFFLYLL